MRTRNRERKERFVVVTYDHSCIEFFPIEKKKTSACTEDIEYIMLRPVFTFNPTLCFIQKLNKSVILLYINRKQ